MFVPSSSFLVGFVFRSDVAESELTAHLRGCPTARRLAKQAKQPFFRPGCNAGRFSDAVAYPACPTPGSSTDPGALQAASLKSLPVASDQPAATTACDDTACANNSTMRASASVSIGTAGTPLGTTTATAGTAGRAGTAITEGSRSNTQKHAKCSRKRLPLGAALAQLLSPESLTSLISRITAAHQQVQHFIGCDFYTPFLGLSVYLLCLLYPFFPHVSAALRCPSYLFPFSRRHSIQIRLDGADFMSWDELVGFACVNSVDSDCTFMWCCGQASKSISVGACSHRRQLLRLAPQRNGHDTPLDGQLQVSVEP